MDEDRKKKLKRLGLLVDVMLRKGWRPPLLSERQVHRLLEDMEKITTMERGQDAGSTWKPPTNQLTEAQVSTLQMYADGMNGPEIAKKRGVSRETVKSQVKAILLKTGSETMTQAVARSIRSGVIS